MLKEDKFWYWSTELHIGVMKYGKLVGMEMLDTGELVRVKDVYGFHWWSWIECLGNPEVKTQELG